VVWNDQELLEQAVEALQRREAMLRQQRAPLGLDSWDELVFHPLISDIFSASGLGVYREFPLPGTVGKRSKKSQRERCDLVLTSSPQVRPCDPMEVLIDQDKAPLFAGLFDDVDARVPQSVCVNTDTGEVLEPAIAGHSSPPRLPACALEECYFLELKTLGQFTYVDGVPVPNRRYASELVSAITKDVKKLNADDRVHQGALLLILFTASREVADHDLPIAMHRALDRGVLFKSPRTMGFPVADRVGNGWATCVLLAKFA
jgi:hypothetical protein